MKQLLCVLLGFSTVLSAAPIQQFVLKDRINFPAYSWPRTLLEYRAEFPKSGVDKAALRLVDDATGEAVPFQYSASTIHFFSDLPSGGKRSYSLIQNASIPVPASSAVTAKEHRRFIEIDGNGISCRIPKSTRRMRGDVPGPILALNNGDGWIGSSLLISPNKKVKSIKTECLEDGALFQRWQVRYAFDGGGSYIATITVVNGYPFVDFMEEMTGLEEDDGVVVEMRWDGFDPKYRFGTDSWVTARADGSWPLIDEPIMTSQLEEDPTWDPGVIEEVSKEMWMYLSPYSGNGIRELFPCVSFWEAGEGARELGVFVRDYKLWQDGKYGLWQPTRKLMVRFRYSDNSLYWTWPVASGTRSTALNLFDVEDGVQQVEAMRAIYETHVPKISSNVRFDTKTMRLRYNQLLQQIYGPLSLNKVKDWQLTYPESAKRPAALPLEGGKARSADELEDLLFRSSFVFYPLGQNSWPGINSIQHRFVYDWAVDGLTRLSGSMTPKQRERVDALMLLAGYLLTGEAMHPIRNCMAGAPNMAADGWSVPMEIAYLYPEHPMAEEWREYFQRYWSLSHVYFTRPDLPQFEAHGGRWAESLSVYNWAHLNPTLAAALMGYLTDGIVRTASPETAKRGRWMVDMLTAPIHNPDPYWRQKTGAKKPDVPENVRVRQYPAHGAHGSGTAVMPPDMLHIYAYGLRNYDPLTAEHLFWVKTVPFHENGRGKFDWEAYGKEKLPENSGTPPDLKSCKYTGHGLVLRAGVGTDDELSIHLDQTDRGPNYRWGNGGRGAAGTLYFFADGKIWTGHEREDAGDHDIDDTDGTTTFGVMKNGSYRSIGRNLLDQPLMDLGVAQMATLKSRPGDSAYSWPEYESRSVMLVGTDYFLLYDKVGTIGRTSTRFSWFVPKDGEFPEIAFLKPAKTRQDHWREIITPMAKGFQRDAKGSCLTFVTARKDSVRLSGMQGRRIPFLSFAPIKDYQKKTTLPEGVYRVATATSSDLFFRDETRIEYVGDGIEFSGLAGVVRRLKSGGKELALFGAGSIRVDTFGAELFSESDGISMTETKLGLSGRVYSQKGDAVSMDFQGLEGRLYIDGLAVEFAGGNVEIPKGLHEWEFTASKPKPMVPSIVRTENFAGGAKVVHTETGGAERYEVRCGADAKPVAGAKLSGLEDGKYYVQVRGLNSDQASDWSAVYPLYVSSEPPAHPDGLALELGEGTVTLSWGEVLGASEYRLYRRVRGEQDFELVFQGLEKRFVDKNLKGVVPCALLPGRADNPPYDGIVYEYAVSAVNGNGEGAKSEVHSTDPTSWLNWRPGRVPVEFHRDTEYWKEPYVPAEQAVPYAYPAE